MCKLLRKVFPQDALLLCHSQIAIDHLSAYLFQVPVIEEHRFLVVRYP